MQRILRTLMLSIAVAIIGPGLASATSITFSTNPLVGSPGDAPVTSVLYNPLGALFSTIQFDLVYNDAALTLTSFAKGSAALDAGKDMTVTPFGVGFTNFSFNTTPTIIGPGSLVDLTFGLLAPGPHPLVIAGAVGFEYGSTIPVNITFIGPTTPSVPEPTAVSLLGLGMGALALWRRMKASV